MPEKEYRRLIGQPIRSIELAVLTLVGNSANEGPAQGASVSLCSPSSVGTMIGYRRIVTTLGQRLGKVHLTPAQGAAAETVSAVLIGLSGFSGLPVSTTHIVTSGIAGTMVISGAGLHFPMLSRIVIAWLVTLPLTILIAGGLYYLFESPTAILFK